jgi:putative membrane protein
MGSVVSSVKELLIGIVAGIASMLPGISGATVCVAFGIYERLIRDVANLRTYLRKDFLFIFLLAFGVVLGTVLAAKVLNVLIDDYPAECLLFFAGLIVGQIPMLCVTAGLRDGNRTSVTEWAAFAVGIGIMIAMVAIDFLMDGGNDVVVGTDPVGCVILFLIGMIVVVSMLLPGLSHSTLLVAIGYFAAFTEIVGDLKVVELGIIALGGIVAMLLFSKVLHRALTYHHKVTMFLILGLTIGSVVSVLVFSADYFTSIIHIAACAVLFVIGFFVSYSFMKPVEELEE